MKAYRSSGNLIDFESNSLIGLNKSIKFKIIQQVNECLLYRVNRYLVNTYPDFPKSRWFWKQFSPLGRPWCWWLCSAPSACTANHPVQHSYRIFQNTCGTPEYKWVFCISSIAILTLSVVVNIMNKFKTKKTMRKQINLD